MDELSEYVASFSTAPIQLNDEGYIIASDSWYYLALSVDELRRRGRPPALDHLEPVVREAFEREGPLRPQFILYTGGMELIDEQELAGHLDRVEDTYPFFMPQGSMWLRALLEANALSPDDRESRLSEIMQFPTTDLVLGNWTWIVECVQLLGAELPDHWVLAIREGLRNSWDPDLGIFGQSPSQSREAATLMLTVGVPDEVDLRRMRKAAQRHPGNFAARMEFLLTLSQIETLLESREP